MPNATTYPTMTMAEIEGTFDQEWVLIVDPVIDPSTGDIGRGQVAGHNPERDRVAALLDAVDPRRFAIYFIGRVATDGTCELLPRLRNALR